MKKQKHKPPRIVIGGYYGFQSIGDEAVLYSILSSIKKELPECRISVITGDRHSLPRLENTELKPIPRTNILSLITSLIYADMYISGGGSLFQDSTSSRSLFYYCSLIFLAKLCGCKVVVLANGIGPLKNKKLCTLALRVSDRISLRDKDSYETAKRVLKKDKNIQLSADPIFAYPFSGNRPPLLAALSCLSGNPFFAVSVRKCTDKGQVPYNELKSAINHYRSKGYTPVFVSMQNLHDLQLCRQMAKETDGVVADITNCNELFFLLEKASFAVGMRLHFLLTCAIAKTPFAALSYDCKVDGCTRELSAAPCICAFTMTTDSIISTVDSAVADFSREALHKSCELLSESAISDIKDTLLLLPDSDAARNAESVSEKFFADT